MSEYVRLVVDKLVNGKRPAPEEISTAFEAILVETDFIACSPAAPLACQPSVSSGDAGASDAGVADAAAADAGG